jgi:hypothetical protein
MHNLLKMIIHSIPNGDNSDLSNQFKNLLCDIIDCHFDKQHNSQKPSQTTSIEYYFLASDVSKNKSIDSMYSIDGKQREDFINCTRYQIRKKDDNSIIGEIASFSHKIISFDETQYHYSSIGNLKIEDKLISLPTGNCIYNINDKRFVFPATSIETKDYNGKKVLIEKIADNAENPDRVHYRATFFD